jgi:hypothetical protein
MYQDFLAALEQAGYQFQTFHDFIVNPLPKSIVLRHDVDDRNVNSLLFAQIQNSRGIRGSYYFRVVPESYNPEMMRTMEKMGHEIGLHYEEMDMAKGDIDRAYSLFVEHLNRFRKLVDVKTICMHGSPRSKYDNKAIWTKYHYQDLGIVAEPYFDLKDKEITYLTDTGMMWDGNRYSIRDRMSTAGSNHQFHTTEDMITAIKNDQFPNQCMINFHPQRWNDNLILWSIETIRQRIKNVVKALLVLRTQQSNVVK